MAFCDVLMDSPVPPPIESIPWYCVCSRCKGTMGPKGDRGDRGLPGNHASTQLRHKLLFLHEVQVALGLEVSQGSEDDQDLLGDKASKKGDDGEKGMPGQMGFVGAKGARGFKGEKGDFGMDGPPGPPGAQGEPGECPSSCDTVEGPTGEPGLPGNSGVRGLPGVAGPPGSKGDKGDKGDIGAPGMKGATGGKGEQGEEGECNCVDGAKGAKGAQGIQGPKGDKGAAGLNGTPGTPGTKGDRGDEGRMGIPGPCSPTIQSAFSAALQSIYPQPNLPVPFERVLYNLQGHFDPSLGIYRAPVNGTYVFSYHAVAFSKVLKVGLFHNFVPVVKTTEPNNLSTASQQVVLHLNAGDMVWLQVRDTATNGMYTSAESSSTFSGFLLHPDSCDMQLFRDFLPLPVQGYYNWGDIALPTPAP
ncbi:hypothetical protein JZ751_025735 [Albula glossodonta]|uniref:C1q domain-containing protein n=1 Tax=Albula glossodonta TaxID=121402 RepID=A0A8T2NGS1_9TELE|nr:hypothetical protein JZ751_025735 [Albula glossodonta]